MSQHHADGSPDSFPNPHENAKPAPRRREVPRYKLILHSNMTVDLMFIVRTIMELTRFCVYEATHKMWVAHHSGRSLLLVTYLERAELYVEQFADRGLTVTIEPA